MLDLVSLHCEEVKMDAKKVLCLTNDALSTQNNAVLMGDAASSCRVVRLVDRYWIASTIRSPCGAM